MAPPVTCECGFCAKCKRRIYMRQYYRANAGRCREQARAGRARRLEAARAYDRARGHRIYDEAKERARRVIAHAVADGTLVRQPCEVCGQSNAEAHHDDYTQPLEVRWLCRPHHMELHRTVAA